MIDTSHANSVQEGGQSLVVEAVSRQISSGEDRIMGMMVESNLLAGRQNLTSGTAPIRGRSITDAAPMEPSLG